MKICFWAYKGGTGRSLALANIAIELANRGLNVGMIDMDCEAPGLHVIFNLNKDEIQQKGHLIDLLQLKSLVNLSQYIIDLKSRLNTKGNIYLIPTIDDIRYDDLIWDDNLFRFLDSLTKDFVKLYQLNYLLIDTRTGFSTLSNFAQNVSDLLVMTMRPNRQNTLGIMDAIKGFEIEQKQSYFIVCSEVPQTETSKRALRKIEQELQTKIAASIVYDESLALEEKLIVIEEPDSIVSKEYKKIADLIIEKK